MSSDFCLAVTDCGSRITRVTTMWAFRTLTCLLFCLICSCEFVQITRAEISPTVVVKNGSLAGSLMRSRRDREFFAFRGIPYAQPPLGQLRFEVITSITSNI